MHTFVKQKSGNFEFEFGYSQSIKVKRSIHYDLSKHQLQHVQQKSYLFSSRREQLEIIFKDIFSKSLKWKKLKFSFQLTCLYCKIRNFGLYTKKNSSLNEVYLHVSSLNCLNPCVYY